MGTASLQVCLLHLLHWWFPAPPRDIILGVTVYDVIKEAVFVIWG